METSGFLLLTSLEFGVVFMCFFSIFYLATINWKKNKWLILAFFVFSWSLLNNLLSEERFDIIGYSSFLLNPAPLLLLFPALYFYTFDLVRPNMTISLKRAIHALPFLVFYIIYIIIGFELPTKMVENDAKLPFLFAFMIVTVSIAIFYSYRILKLVWLNQHKYQNQYAESNMFLTLNWIKWMIYIIIGMPIIGATGNTILLKSASELSTFPSTICMLITCSTLAYFSFRQRTLYKEDLPISQRSVTKPTEVSKKVISKASKKNGIEKGNTTSSFTISESEKKAYIAQIESYIEAEQPYLNPKIRMPELANSLKIPRHIFSYLINEHYQMNFFYFINQYRIEYAKALLLDKENAYYTLETIGKMAGFNSKSTFNTRFKEVIGKSPTAYRKDMNKE